MQKEYQNPEELFQQPLPRLRSLDLICPKCDEPIAGGDINIHTSLAHCKHCSNTFQLEEWNNVRQKTEVFMPHGIEVLKLNNELDIELTWRRSLNTFLTIFTIFWNSIIFVIAAVVILSGNYSALLFLSIHLSVGIGLLYHTLTKIFNRTNITVNRYRLLIEHRPLKLPFYPDRNIPIGDIEQVFVEKYTASTNNGQPNYAYSVNTILKGNKRIQLLKGMKHPDQALYIEQEIEHFLQIEDKKVLGEWGGDVLNR